MNAIAGLVVDGVPDGRRALVGIDGVDGSGKTMFAAALASQLDGRSVVVIHLDDFHNRSVVRYRRGRDSPVGFWLDTYNYDAIRQDVFEPLRATGHGGYRVASYDAATDRDLRSPRRHAADDAIVLIEGMFLHRDGLADVWDYSLFLDVPFEETARRMASRNGSHPDPRHESMRRYVGGQELYFAGRPWERASLVIDNSVPGCPVVIAAREASAARWESRLRPGDAAPGDAVTASAQTGSVNETGLPTARA